MTEAMVIEAPYDFIKIAERAKSELEINEVWWRGQKSDSSDWTLRPKVYRKDRTHDYEKGIFLHFMRKAASPRYPNCPTENAYDEWLFLMQHYGLPTRLLDWTESPLVALFFAVSDSNYDNESGTLWVLSPSGLNEAMIELGEILIPPDKRIEQIVNSILDINAEPDYVERILALFPPHRDLRMLIQQSAFTLHGTNIPLEELQNEINNQFLLRIDIPSTNKEKLREILMKTLRIQESDLFPDLEHLAKELESTNFIE